MSATMIVERFIAIAPTLMGRFTPHRGKFSDERPVPKFKEKMNAGTISEWLSHNDHTQGRN